MKLAILNKEGKKVSEKETKLFEEPIRIDIIAKVVEAEKSWQPWSPRFRAGMDRSASGNVRHRRHVWKSDRGRGLSRIPKKAFWRRGTQFSWEGAIVPFTRGGRRAHPPKGEVNDKKINKKELLKALRSALSYVGDKKEVIKKYKTLKGVDVKLELPLIVDGGILGLSTKDFLESLRAVLGDLSGVAVQKKSVRAGIGKMRGRKYKKNAGLLLVIGNEESLKVKGVDVVNVNDLIVSDLASNGARLVMFSEDAIEELEGVLINNKNISNLKQDKDGESGSRVGKSGKKIDKRKVKKAKSKKVGKKKKGNKIISNLKNEGEDIPSKESESNPDVVKDTNKNNEGVKENA